MSNRLPGFLVAALSLGIAACGGDSLTLPPSTGAITITTVTGGSEPDADGYTLTVDSQQPQSIASSGTVTLGDLVPGTHNILLSGMAPNCSVAGDNPRTLTVAVGETTTSEFDLTCDATTGGLEVTTQTSGADQDADGYSISVDGTDRGPIGASATVTLGNLAPGSHVVGLAGVANNCHIDGDPLKAVTIAQGQTASATFAVVCSQLPPDVGNLQITTVTSGNDQDDNGYQFSLDGGQARPIGISTTALLTSIAVGQHSVALSNVAGNCSADENSKDVTITSGQTAVLTFTVTCDAIPPTTGTIHVTTTTSGDNQDADGYTFSIDNGADQSIGATDAKDVPNVPTGRHTVVLSGLADNCHTGDASKDVDVRSGQTDNAAFTVTCESTGPSASKSSIASSSKNIFVGETSTITVTVRNAGNDRVAGTPVTLSSTGSGNTVTPASANTDANGVATFTFSSTVAEDKTITATAGGITLSHAVVITVSRRPSTTTITSVQPEPSTAGTSIHVTVQVTGTGGSTPTGTVAIFSTTEAAGCDAAPLDPTGNAACDFVLSQPGDQTISATYSGDGQFLDSTDPDGAPHTVTPTE